MRVLSKSRAVGLSTIALFASAGAAQPHKLYVWTPTGTGTFHGQTVLDAGVGGGTGPTSGPFTLIVKPDGQLQGSGNNGFGQFGYAPNYPSMPPAFTQFPCILNPTWCKSLPHLGNAVTDPFVTYPMLAISCGWDHILGLSDHPDLAATRGLIAWGRNEPDDTNSPCNIPLWDANGVPQDPWNIISTAKVAKFSAGEFINIVLFDNGQIAAWGDKTWGVDPRAVNTSVPWRNGFRPQPSWRFKDVIAGGHFVMALILEAPDSSLPVHPVTGRRGEGYIISWGMMAYDNEQLFAAGPGFHGYKLMHPPTGTFTSPLNLPNSIQVNYYPPYDALISGHQVAGGIIKNPTPDQSASGMVAGTTHLWGINNYNAITDLPANTTFEQVQAGYTQWMVGLAIENLTTTPPTPLATLLPWGLAGGSIGPQPPSVMPVTNRLKLRQSANASNTAAALCYDPNCDGSVTPPVLTANDMVCFTNKWAEATNTDPSMPILTPEQQRRHYCNCDGSTGIPALTANDFVCFVNKFTIGPCP